MDSSHSHFYSSIRVVCPQLPGSQVTEDGWVQVTEKQRRSSQCFEGVLHFRIWSQRRVGIDARWQCEGSVATQEAETRA